MLSPCFFRLCLTKIYFNIAFFKKFTYHTAVQIKTFHAFSSTLARFWNVKVHTAAYIQFRFAGKYPIL